MTTTCHLSVQQSHPRFISISAAFRYTVTNDYLLAKGELFKGQGGSGKGGAALITPLDELTRHGEYATPVRSQADDWIEAVVDRTATPGNPGKWREWGTVRHIEVVAFQLSTLT
ncbi:beta family protein [uncultured Microbacterium sp.]|uniref:beta family protein n=1 Tax=uncultured Microbacterium sp. TaxID=191216 RepID=UPI0034230A05